MSDSENKEAKENKILHTWMIRPCWLYKDEYEECSCWKARFHQYFIHGTTIDCSTWKEDYENCKIWEKHKSMDAYDALIENETVRRRKRLAAHFGNKVWKKRDKPPENWSGPLPEWMEERQENSILSKLKQEDLQKSNAQYCSIM